MKNKNILLLVIGILLLGYGVVSKVYIPQSSNSSVVVVAPLDNDLKNDCGPVIEAFKNGSSNRVVDGVKLSNLYSDLAKLISLETTDEVVKNTLEIREANKLAGLLYDLRLKDKYPDLAKEANALVVKYIGDDNVVLDDHLRKKAVDVFNALSWACYEGSK